MEKIVTTLYAKRYYMIIYLLIVIMVSGLFYKNPLHGEGHIGYYLHLMFVVLFSACLLIYPKYRSSILRWLIVLVATLLFYTLFLVYPETGSTILLIYFIPTISIIFFDKRLFYTSIILNQVLIIGAITYIISSGQESLYPNVTSDTAGNIITFIGSQIFLYFIFYYTSERIAKMKLYYEQIKHAERLKTTGELAAAVAHEIRNPLTVVKGYLQLYEQDKSVSNSMKQSLPLLIEELDSAEQVISELLSLSQPTKNLKTERVDIQKSINSVAELLQSYGILNQNKIEVAIESDSYIEINKMELHQLLVNVVKNAIEASSVGGAIVVTARKTNEDYVEIKVQDRGIGMSEEELELLGKPFYSLKNKGTGLGVMICNNIVEKYNGSIQYISSKGNGTTVIIRFPSVCS
ncbi:ATP-binding protein [Ureibacillus sp. GCM10028918]|uniref:ATP-binding protein n=1 Tax=Ureibacillus sp. GCM10028918 TaxID=3273429 RepID=UPI00360ABA56